MCGDEAGVTALVDVRILLDHQRLADVLPTATAQVMAEKHGNSVQAWENAYRKIQADWYSYWADLSLSGEDSLEQWREGQWRVTRALFRLVGYPPPDTGQMDTYLDILPQAVGQRIAAWQPGVEESLSALSRVARLCLLSPYLSEMLIWGMVEEGGLRTVVDQVVGPNSLGQVSLSGLNGSWLAALAHSELEQCVLIGPEPVPGIAHLLPPDDLSQLTGLFRSKTNA